jgi:hypothetical protein
MSQSDVIREAIKNGGGLSVVAKALNMSEEGVRLWKVRGHVPDKRLLDFERVTGVPRAKLRPDLYAPPLQPKQQAAWQRRERRQMRG